MKTRELANLGCPKHLLKLAAAAAAASGQRRAVVRETFAALFVDPEPWADDPVYGAVSRAVLAGRNAPPRFVERAEPAPWRQWGEDLDAKSVEQLDNACRLPIAVAGALMPDAHLGYGLPIGGVLATDHAVIPYAVGVDIACRMRMSILDLPPNAVAGQTDRLVGAIEEETRFGIGAKFSRPRDHAVMDEDWSVSPVTAKHRDKAWSQLGTSGSGNHFVEFGVLEAEDPEGAGVLGIEPGCYLALLTHSGSRGTGASVAAHYSKLAMDRHPELPKPLRHLAWLELDSEPGREYWAAMSLMGAYAAANHAVIHRSIIRALGADVLAGVENHHNFAWIEEHAACNDGQPVVVHRKGATPAGRGVLGIIPGSMATPAFIVRGRGEPTSLESASHGAGRVMSRRQAKQTFTWSQARKLLADREVRLLSAGLDEVPMVYKDIHAVMAAQRDLVEVVARFLPKIVKMAPDGERAED